MSLKKATLFTIVGISYIFLSRTLASFAPQLFNNLQLAKTNTLLSLLASLTPLFFYFLFYKEYFPGDKQSLSRKQLMLKNSAIFAFLGSLAVSFIFLKGFLHLVNNYGQAASQGYFEVIVPWLSSLFALFFYCAFFQSEKNTVSAALTKAVMFAMVGSGLAVILHSYLLFEFAVHGSFKWLWNLAQGNLFIFLPLYLFMFFAGFYFLWCLYREVGKKGNSFA